VITLTISEIKALATFAGLDDQRGFDSGDMETKIAIETGLNGRHYAYFEEYKEEGGMCLSGKYIRDEKLQIRPGPVCSGCGDPGWIGLCPKCDNG
jgi:hypothetical protein